MSFTKRKIDLTFQLGKGQFGLSGTDTVKVSGLRTRVEIANAGGASMGTANVRVHGLPLSIMNDLAQVMRLSEDAIETRWNNIIIEAGDDAVGMSQIFQGQIILSPIDMGGQPISTLNLSAHAGYFQRVKTTDPISFPGTADAAVILQNLAAQEKLTFENNGVSVILSTPYFPGNPFEQIRRCAEAANINWTIDNGILAIWPKGSSRRTGLIPLISPSNGMVGYPTNWNLGVAVKSIFNPQLILGKLCRVESSLPFANGQFIMFEIGHQLESEMPGGAWYSTFKGSPANAGT